MKPDQKTARDNKLFRTSILIIAGVLAGGALPARASVWTGASPTGSPLWSEPANWDTFLAPTAGDTVTFNNGGATNVLGAVNNVVDGDTTITNLTYLSEVSFISLVTNYQTTLINPGATLTIDRGTNGGGLLYVGTWDTQSHDNQYYYTVVGPGASLVAGDISAPVASQGLQVTATYRNAFNHIGSLDLSGLDHFACAGGYFWVGINGDSAIAYDRPAGRVYLAKTNIIVMTGNAYDLSNLGSFRVGESRGNTPGQRSLLELGQENSIYTPWLKVGGARTGTGQDLGGYMYFRSGLSNPTLKLRGTDGVSRLGTVRIGDNSWSTSGSSIGTRGVVDLSGGTVDAFIEEMFVGRGPGGNNTTAAGASAGANGILTWTAGTVDVNTLLIGYQYGNNLSTNTGIVNVQGPAARLIADRLVLARDAGSNAGGGAGTLNIDGGTVEIKNYLSESGDNALSTVIITNNGVLNLQPEGDLTPAIATIDILNYSSGNVTNGTLALTNVTVLPPAEAFPLNPGTVLDPGTVGTPAILDVAGSLSLNGGTVDFDIADSGSLDQVNVSSSLNLSAATPVAINLLGPVTAGSFTLMTYGSLSGAGALSAVGPIADSRYTVSFSTPAPNVTMNISGEARSLLWSGGNNANNWDLKSTMNWNGGTDRFYAYDSVEFGEGGSSTPPVNLVGTLIPGAVLFSANSTDYTFGGSGKISGVSGITLNGTGTLTVLTTNDYKGTTDINMGTLVVGNGTTADGALGSGAINNASTLVFNPAGTQTNTSVIAGYGTVVKRGPGVTILSGNNTFTGPLTVEAGTLQAGSATALGDASFAGGMATVNSGATLDLGGQGLGTKPITVSGPGVGNAGAIINSGSAQFLRDVQLAGATTFGGTAGWTIASSAANSTDPGLSAYGYKLTKVGANQVKVNGLRSAPWDLDLGEVDIQEGVLSLYGIISLGTHPSQPITVRSNATLELGSYPAYTLSKAYVLDAGSCLFTQGTNSVVDGSFTLGGRAVVDVANGRALTVNCPIDGTGPLVKGIGSHPASSVSTGAGSLILDAANSFSGDLLIQTGSVVLSNNATLATANIILEGGTLSILPRSDSTLTLNSGQALRGSGSILGSVSAPAGSILAPSATNGVLAVTGSITLRGTTYLDVNRTGAATNNSRITATGTLDCGGALVLTSSGEALKSGDSFELFAAGTLLNPFENSAISWPALAEGLYWTNRLGIDGTIAVAGSTEPATPPTISVSVLNGQLSLQWPQDYTSYVLQGQTNTIGSGLSTNWHIVTGIIDNQFTVPLDPANGNVFYRLIKQ